MAAEFADETSVRSERTIHSGDNFGRIAHPVQRRVAEYGIEFVIEIESFTAHYPGVQVEFARGFDLLSAGVHTDDMASQLGELGGEHTVAAAQIQDALASTRRK